MRKRGRRRGVSDIIATILLVAIVVVLAAVLYLLTTNLVKGPSSTTIGGALGLGNPTLVQGGVGATFPPCAAADFCYEVTVASASGITPSSFDVYVRTVSATTWSGVVGGGGVAISDIKGASIVSSAVAAGAPFAVTAWTAGAGYTTTSPVTNSDALWLDMGTASPAGQGYQLVFVGVGTFSGQTSVNLP
jgi:flagellin-like protein